jgi:hypothetical protein
VAAAGAKGGATTASAAFGELDQLQLQQRQAAAGGAGAQQQEAQQQEAASSPGSPSTAGASSAGSSGASSSSGRRPIVFVASSELEALVDSSARQQAALQPEALEQLARVLGLPGLASHFTKLHRLLPAADPDKAGNGASAK